MAKTDLEVSVTADVSEAIRGFKALTKAVREATRAIREWEDTVRVTGYSVSIGSNVSESGTWQIAS